MKYYESKDFKGRQNSSRQRPGNAREKQNGFENKFYEGEPKPVFSNKKGLFVATGSNINLYNPTGGNLLEVLKGHTHKIVSLGKTEINNEEVIASCDEQANVFYWYSDRDAKKDSSISISPNGNYKITHFSVSGSLYIFTFVFESPFIAKLCLVKPPYNQKKSKIFLSDDLSPGQNKVSVSYDGKHLAALSRKGMHVIEVDTISTHYERRRFHLGGRQTFLCVAFHPSKAVIATGSKRGIIHLWYHYMETRPTKVELHWHTLPLYDLCFSQTGNDLYSGSGECVLVRWYLTDDNRKAFLPRLGTPIVAVQTDSSESMVVTLHEDSCLKIIDSREMVLKGSIQRMTTHTPNSSGSLLSAGLLYHPPTGSLVKNSSTGFLQFFDPRLKKIVYNLDIAMCNFVTQERNCKLPNSDITKAALSEDGSWLITCELCNLTPSVKEIVMKFWEFSKKDQRWTLNTNIHMPHSDIVNSIVIRPLLEGEAEAPMCVSCSEEGKFNIWNLLTYEDVLGKLKQHWNTRFSRDFKGLAATSASFSADGSLLAVAFDHIVTLWTPHACSLVGTLSQPDLTERILDVAFSRREVEGSSLVCRSEEYLCSWNLLSCSLRWRVFLHSTCLTVDQTSGLMAVFSNKKEVFVFEPQSSQPLVSQCGLCETDVACASFVPSGRKESYLCFFDTDQNFYTIKDILSLEAQTQEDQLDSTVRETKESEMYSALVAKSRSRAQQEADDDDIPVSLIPTSMKSFMKEMNDIRVHNISFRGLLNHMESFLPNIGSDTQNSKGGKNFVKYSTIEEDSSEAKQDQKAFNHNTPLNDANTLAQIQNLDFSQLVKNLTL